MTSSTVAGVYTPQSWMTQAEHDLETARLLRAEERADWASYAAAQAAEKAVKAMLVAWGADLTGGARAKAWRIHELSELFHAFRRLPKSQKLADALTVLPSHDQDARYPDAQSDDSPCNTYTDEIASNAIELATAVVDYARHLVPAIEAAVTDLEKAARDAVAALEPDSVS